MIKEKLEGMDDGKEKELLKILEGNEKPYVRKCDGYAHKVDEDKEIKYKDYNDQELTLKVPKGSYIVTDSECSYPKIVTADDFEGKNKMLSEDKAKKVKKDNDSKTGMDLMSEDSY